MNTHEILSIVMGMDEGVHRKPYRDTQNLWTIGIGHLIGARLEDLELSPAVVALMFQEDVEKHWTSMEKFFGKKFIESLEPARQVAIFSLVYTLGTTKLKRFTSTVPAIKAKNWQLAHDLLLKTKWARDVDPPQRDGVGRDDRVAYMLLTGEFHPEYQIEKEILC